MMTDKILINRAVVEQAIEALFMYKPMVTGVTFQHGLDAMRALRAALEQPQVEQEPVSKSDNYLNGYCTGRTDLLKELQVEQEPVAWIENIGGGIGYNPYHDAARKLPDGVRFDLYTHQQPPRQPLTREAIDAIIKSNFVSINDQNLYDAIYLCMRDVESAHDIEEQK